MAQQNNLGTEAFSYRADQRTGNVTFFGGFPSPESMRQVINDAQRQRDVTFGDIQGLYTRLDRVIELMEIVAAAVGSRGSPAHAPPNPADQPPADTLPDPPTEGR